MDQDSMLWMLYDLIVVTFNLLIFIQVFTPRDTGILFRSVMYLGCGAIITGYFAAVYMFHWPSAAASVFMMTLPSLILFYFLSRYRDARFFLTFCFVDSVALIIAFIGVYCGYIWPEYGRVLSPVVTFLIFLSVFLLGKRYFKRYHSLMEVVREGWCSMAVCSVVIYFTQIFFSVSPSPLSERIEYAPSYLIFSLTVLSFYAVFINSMYKTRKIYEQNKKLEHEKQIFEIAYRDALTGLYNRAAYIEQSSRLERDKGSYLPICCMMLDMNNFKRINDSMGHHKGDEALRRAADALKEAFSGLNHHVYRMGGDEFTVLMTNSSCQEAEERIECLNRRLKSAGDGYSFPLCMAAGYDMVESEADSIEKALVRADQNMYRDKFNSKVCKKEKSDG